MVPGRARPMPAGDAAVVITVPGVVPSRTGTAGWAVRRPLLAFVVRAYAISWTLWLPGLRGGVGGLSLQAAGAFGPARPAGSLAA